MIEAAAISLRARVAAHVVEKITCGEWNPGDRIPSESMLTDLFGASRMTVHHALRDLTARGFLVRRSGSGTFVAEPGAYVAEYAHLDVIAEIGARGGRHSAEVFRRELRPATDAEAAAFEVGGQASLFHAIILHREEGEPLELEDRLIAPRFMPDAMAIDLSGQTLFSRLMLVRPYRQGSETLRATLADAEEARLLGVEDGAPCLEVCRRTWSEEGIVTIARMVRAGNQARMVGRIKQADLAV